MTLHDVKKHGFFYQLYQLSAHWRTMTLMPYLKHNNCSETSKLLVKGHIVNILDFMSCDLSYNPTMITKKHI